ncbi:Flp family type IVb pilin [Roseinatronobacter sp. S2]|uniref:Flp family type IVb pilin n=1 Tax=Roseinatronobacter sp. S2 TaxID=3035471 RepID=UPI00240F3BF0|nr:Flp family type IVb pilin [Roseinatronobacter sp. S2]WFE75903.1 Flp family type IVb pilin [Roseinatronobacter sp. S2]
MTKIKTFFATEKGAALVEYGILVGLIAVLAIAAVLALGEQVQNVFLTVDSTLESNLGPDFGQD